MQDTDLAALGSDFWAWRAAQQPRSHDDIVRIDRPTGWLPDFSADTIARYHTQVAEFAERLAAIDDISDPADEVDYRLMRSAIRRVTWELDDLRLWQIHPGFYLDPTVGCVFDLLTPVTVDAAMLGDVSRMFAATTDILATGSENLHGHAVAEFAELTVGALDGIEAKVVEVASALNRVVPTGWSADDASALEANAATARAALAEYR